MTNKSLDMKTLIFKLDFSGCWAMIKEPAASHKQVFYTNFLFRRRTKKQRETKNEDLQIEAEETEDKEDQEIF